MKIVADVQSRTYEVTYLVADGFTETELSQIHDEIVSHLEKKLKATITKDEDWGKLRMAYAIKHGNKAHTQAVYRHLVVEMLPEQAPKLNRHLDLHNQVMRHLVVKATAAKDAEAKPAAA